jgi:hypothetical protein
LNRPTFAESVLFLYGPFLLTVIWTFASTADDPFVTLRYAANLVHGYGLAFNPGEHVQGFTSPLHLLVAVVSYSIPGGHDLFKLKLASLLFGLFAIREASRLIYGISLPRWAKRTACVAVATSWIIAFASGNGLETTLVVWLLISLARRLVLNGPQQSRNSLALFAFAAVLARLDALVPIICMAGLGLLGERSLVAWRRISWFGGAVLGLIVTTVGEVVLFHTVLPNTYYAKDMAHETSLSKGLGYLLNPLPQGGSPVVLPHGIPEFVLLVQILFVAAGIVAVARHHRRCAYLVAIFVGQALFVLGTGGDWMLGGRFLAPGEIPLIVTEVLGLVVTVDFFTRRMSRHFAQCAAVVGAAVLVSASFLPIASVHAPTWKIKGIDDLSLLSSGQYPYSPMWSTLPSDLSCLHAGQLVATSEVGYLGFARLDLRMLDLRGLTNSAIATQSPASDKYPWGVQDANWYIPTSPVGRVILRQNPAIIASIDPAPPQVLGGRYRLVKVSSFPYNYYFSIRLSFYARSGSIGNCLQLTGKSA